MPLRRSATVEKTRPCRRARFSSNNSLMRRTSFSSCVGSRSTAALAQRICHSSCWSFNDLPLREERREEIDIFCHIHDIKDVKNKVERASSHRPGCCEDTHAYPAVYFPFL